MMPHMDRAARDFEGVLTASKRAAEAYRRLGALRWAYIHGINTGFYLNVIGAYEQARVVLERVIESLRAIDNTRMLAAAQDNLVMTYIGLGDAVRGREVADAARDALRSAADARLFGSATGSAARARLAQGEVEAAVVLAREAARLLAEFPVELADALGTLAEALLRRGDVEQAVAASEEAHSLARRVVDYGMDQARVTRVEALLASGREADARDACSDACAILDARAASLLDPELRAAFERTSYYRATRELARRLLGRERPFG